MFRAINWIGAEQTFSGHQPQSSGLGCNCNFCRWNLDSYLYDFPQKPNHFGFVRVCQPQPSFRSAKAVLAAIVPESLPLPARSSPPRSVYIKSTAAQILLALRSLPSRADSITRSESSNRSLISLNVHSWHGLTLPSVTLEPRLNHAPHRSIYPLIPHRMQYGNRVHVRLVISVPSSARM